MASKAADTSEPTITKGTFESATGRELAPVNPMDSDDTVSRAPVPATEINTDKPDFDSSDLAMPLLRLAQGLTPEVQEGEAKPGDWILTGYPPVKDATLYPVGYAKTRLKGHMDGDTFIRDCSSPNGKQGYGNPGIPCNTCPFAEWSQDPSGNSVGPACQMTYHYYCYSPTHQQVVEVRFRKSATKAATLINSFANSRGLGNFAIVLSGLQNKNRKGIFYTPQPRIVPGDPTDLEAARLFMPKGKPITIIPTDDVLDNEA